MLDPVLIAYTAKRSRKGKAVWTRIGEAYPHDTGAGLTIKLSAIPFDGVIILLELDERDQARLSHEAERISGMRRPSDEARPGKPIS